MELNNLTTYLTIIVLIMVLMSLLINFRTYILLVQRIIRGNKKEHVNIWVRNSSVKLGNRKTSLIEVVSPINHFCLFQNRIESFLLKNEPMTILEQIKEKVGAEELLELITNQKVFYLNGRKIELV